jgi:hypothetical protein
MTTYDRHYQEIREALLKLTRELDDPTTDKAIEAWDHLGDELERCWREIDELRLAVSSRDAEIERLSEIASRRYRIIQEQRDEGLMP